MQRTGIIKTGNIQAAQEGKEEKEALHQPELVIVSNYGSTRIFINGRDIAHGVEKCTFHTDSSEGYLLPTLEIKFSTKDAAREGVTFAEYITRIQNMGFGKKMGPNQSASLIQPRRYQASSMLRTKEEINGTQSDRRICKSAARDNVPRMAEVAACD